jgi:hypothetical protein
MTKLRQFWWLALVLTACEPDHGVRLTYSSGMESAPVVQKRLDRFGLKYRFAPQGQGFVITLPGATPGQAAQVKELLGAQAKLELAWVIDGEATVQEGAQWPEGVEERSEGRGAGTHLAGPNRQSVEAAARLLVVPRGRVLVSEEEGGGFRTWVLDPKALLTNDDIATAQLAENLD